MSRDISANEQQQLEQITTYIARELSQGKKKEKIAKELMKNGFSEPSAIKLILQTEQLIENYKNSPEGRQVMVSAAKRHMIFGLLWFGGGLTITLATYSAASDGGFYIITWGAILWGIIDFFRGLLNWYKYKN